MEGPSDRPPYVALALLAPWTHRYPKVEGYKHHVYLEGYELPVLNPETMWLGTVVVDGMVHEPGGYHPYTTTIALRLRESDRVPVDGGFRVSLISSGSTSDVKHSVHLTDGLLLCSGTGTETLTNDTFGYLETKAGKTVYHLAIPRAFGAFACGQNRSVKANRIVVIGRGDPESAAIETEDPVVRVLDKRGTFMQGSFESKKSRGAVRYEYKISWSVTRVSETR